MSTLTKEKWNKDSERTSIDRLPSVYAINIVSQIKLNSLICDVGSANGVDLILFAKSGSQIVLLDISDYALSKAKEIDRRENLEEKIETYAVDLDNENLNFEENYFIMYIHIFHCTILIEREPKNYQRKYIESYRLVV